MPRQIAGKFAGHPCSRSSLKQLLGIEVLSWSFLDTMKGGRGAGALGPKHLHVLSQAQGHMISYVISETRATAGQLALGGFYLLSKSRVALKVYSDQVLGCRVYESVYSIGVNPASVWVRKVKQPKATPLTNHMPVGGMMEIGTWTSKVLYRNASTNGIAVEYHDPLGRLLYSDGGLRYASGAAEDCDDIAATLAKSLEMTSSAAENFQIVHLMGMGIASLAFAGAVTGGAVILPATAHPGSVPVAAALGSSTSMLVNVVKAIGDFQRKVMLPGVKGSVAELCKAVKDGEDPLTAPIEMPDLELDYIMVVKCVQRDVVTVLGESTDGGMTETEDGVGVMIVETEKRMVDVCVKWDWVMEIKP